MRPLERPVTSIRLWLALRQAKSGPVPEHAPQSLFLRTRLLPSKSSAAARTLYPRAVTAMFVRFVGTMKRVRLLDCSTAARP